METPNSPPMPSDEVLTPTAKLGRPPIPGTDGTDEFGIGAGAGVEAGGTSMDEVLGSSATAPLMANKLELAVKQKVSTKALNKVILLKTVLLTSNRLCRQNLPDAAGIAAIMGSTTERVK